MASNNLKLKLNKPLGKSTLKITVEVSRVAIIRMRAGHLMIKAGAFLAGYKAVDVDVRN